MEYLFLFIFLLFIVVIAIVMSFKSDRLNIPQPITLIPILVKTIYFAGQIFSLQQISGNEILADAITKQSAGKYQFILPQTR